MWMAQRQRRDYLEEPAAQAGEVTLAGDTLGVSLEGEKRSVTVCSPGGYHWTPAAGASVLVVKAGQEGAPWVVGQDQTQETQPGEVYLSVAQGAGILLKANGEIALTGRVTINGEEV